MAIFVVALVFGLGFGVKASAATYYVRADGTAANKTIAIGPTSDPAATMNLATYNAQTFSPGDTIYFSALGGNYTSVTTISSFVAALHAVSSGNSSSDISYIGLLDGAGGAKPLIDVSGNAANAMGIQISGKDYVTVQNFKIKGSGGGPGLRFGSNSGLLGDGYTIKVRDVDILSNYGASDAGNSHDCFAGGSGTGDYSQAEFWNITATGCRPNPQAAGSHQAFTLHEYEKAKIHVANFSDSNNGISPVTHSQLIADHLTMSNMWVTTVDVGGASDASIVITDSIFNIDGAGSFVASANGSLGSLSISNSVINITGGKLSYVYTGIVNFTGNTWTIDSTAYKLYAETNGTINIAGDTFNIASTIQGVFDAADAANAVINVSGSTFIVTGGAPNHLLEATGVGVLNAHNNVFINYNGTGVAGWAFLNGTLNWYNNTHYNSAKSGTALQIQSGGTINNKNNIFYNIATPCSGGNCGAAGYTSSYNDYYNYTTATNQGTGSITSNPLFVNAGTDFHLQSTSPAINAGTSVGLTTDYAGNPVPSGPTPDIGAYEFQDSTPPTTTANVDTGLYNSAQTVTLTCSDGSGVGCDKTYYTTDGSTPTTSSSQYSVPLAVPSTTTLKFFSRDRNENAETVKTKTYTIDMEAPAVTNNTAVKFHTDTTSVILSLATSENSTCHYSANQSDVYADMTTFATTGTTAHSSIVSNLTHGTYAYYVICRDTFGNDTRYTLAFEIAQRENDTGISDAKLKVDEKNNKTLNEDTKFSFDQNEGRLKGQDVDLASGTVKIYKEGKRYATVDVDSEGSWSKKISFGHNKTYTLTLKFYDEYGTLRDEKDYDVKVDTEKPIFTDPFSKTLTIQKDDKINFLATDDTGVDYYKIQVLDTRGHVVRSWRRQDQSFYLIPESALDQASTIVVRAYDKAGNSVEEKASFNIKENQTNAASTTISETIPNDTASANDTSKPSICSYTVASGDTLRSIAKTVYGDATAYALIIEENKERYADIESKLSLGQELTFCDNNQNSQTTENNPAVGTTDTADQQTETSQQQSQSSSPTGGFKWWNPFTWF